MSTEPPFLIELFGQPGAGKTSLARAAGTASELRTRAHLGAAWQKLPTLNKGSFLGRAILDGACLFRATQLAIRARLYRDDSLSRLSRLLIKSHWIRAQSGRHLLEEGCLQELWSVCYSAGWTEPDPQQLAPLIRCLYRGVDAQIVSLEIDPNSAFDRIRGRTHGKSRLDRLAEAELRERLMATAQLSHRLEDAATLAGLRVNTLDASQPLETNVRRLRAVMEEVEKSAAA